MIEYSVVIPVYNEEDSVRPLYESLKEVMDSLGKSYEIIFVNDGSTDRTLRNLREIEKSDPLLFVISFGRNLGQTASLKVGFQLAKGEIVVSMDGDLQNDPRDIPALLKKLDEDYEVVCGWRKKRFDSVWKKSVSRFANVIQNAVFRSHLHDISCTLRAYRRECVKDLDLARPGLHRFIPYLLMEKQHNKMAEIEVSHHPRAYGKSKHGPQKVFKVTYDFMKFALRRWRKKGEVG